VRFDSPPPGEELNTGEVSEPRQAATVIVLRDSDQGPEVLLVQRNPEQRFMGGAWVFPGGATDPGEDHAEAARREAKEESGLDLDPEHLVPFSRWITPEHVKVRFDTWFYVAAAPPGAEPVCDGEECVDLRWLTPGEALAAGERDELMLMFPTVKHLEQLAEFESVAHALDTARGWTVEAVEPKVVVREDHAEVLLPGEPGYDA
jgi:8-oxo-dGTP pyrophosphatase MutT (NUDIX family)